MSMTVESTTETEAPAHAPGPEFTYFADGQDDKLASLLWQLAQELHVTRQRLLHLEQLLVDRGGLAPGELDTYRPEASHAERIAADGKGMVDRLMRTIAEADDRRAPMRAQYATRFSAEQSND